MPATPVTYLQPWDSQRQGESDCIYIHQQPCMHACMHACMHGYMHRCIHGCMHVYVACICGHVLVQALCRLLRRLALRRQTGADTLPFEGGALDPGFRGWFVVG